MYFINILPAIRYKSGNRSCSHTSCFSLLSGLFQTISVSNEKKHRDTEVSLVTCHLPPVTCHLPPVTCHLPPVTCLLPLSFSQDYSPPTSKHKEQSPMGFPQIVKWPKVLRSRQENSNEFHFPSNRTI